VTLGANADDLACRALVGNHVGHKVLSIGGTVTLQTTPSNCKEDRKPGVRLELKNKITPVIKRKKVERGGVR